MTRNDRPYPFHNTNPFATDQNAIFSSYLHVDPIKFYYHCSFSSIKSIESNLTTIEILHLNQDVLELYLHGNNQNL